MDGLVLSIFPGIGLLDRAFEQEGFTVVRGPDRLWGGDIREFHPPAGVFDGVIGGDPCQAHMRLSRLNRALGREPRYPDMTPEYCRVIVEAQPRWFLRENVPDAPDPSINGYVIQKLKLNNRWVGGEQNRERRFWFGTRDGRHLDVDVVLLEHPSWDYAVISGHGGGFKLDRGGRASPAASIQRMATAARRPWERLCELQGVPPDFLADAPFTVEGKRRVLCNGVPLQLGTTLARAVKKAMSNA